MEDMNTHRHKIAEGVILGRNRKYVWVKIPSWNPHIILTMPRNTLPQGMAQARLVEIKYDSWSMDFNGSHFVADLEIKRVIEESSDDKANVGEAPTDLDSSA